MLVMAMFSCFLRTLHADSKSLHQFTFPQQLYKAHYFAASLPACAVCFVDTSQSDWGKIKKSM